MGLFSIFGTGGTQTTNGAPVASPAPAPTTAPAPAPTPAPAPMSEFSGIWDSPTTATTPDPFEPGKIFANAKLDVMQKAAGNVDFTQGIDPELVKTALGGGEGAAAALLAVINKVGQGAYAQAAFASTQITDKGLQQFNVGLDKRLPTHIKKLQVSDGLSQDNPAFSNPAIAPIVKAIEAQLIQQFPTAPAHEIQAMAKKYLTSAAGLISPSAEGTGETGVNGNRGKPKEEDWGAFFNSSSSMQ